MLGFQEGEHGLRLGQVRERRRVYKSSFEQQLKAKAREKKIAAARGKARQEKEAEEVIVVMLESLAGTGHRLFRQRPKVGEKLEFLYRDPFVQEKVLYREVKKVKTIRSK
ncbi:39S ribosomal protein l33, mitochondrial [Plakobranchus ocellatus]|uniref:Large ribosomal subunit protein bL33m n=1 Tax=Plakobranchus ocellatus TaxID=259542 RepID=A0AAV4AAB9_9GAST|nr:39S ribosomal protein l33, mitochondrial [Plakobranchus ocellatus]